MIINRKVIRTMMESKSQYLGSLILIIISCLLYTMFNLLTLNMSESSRAFEKNYIQEDSNFIPAQTPDINELEDRFGLIMEEVRTLDYPVSEGKTLRLFSENEKVNLPAVIEGEKLKGNDILIDPEYAGANGISIGDGIKIYDKIFKVRGFMSLPNYIYPLKAETDLLSDPYRFGIAVISKLDFEELNKGNISYSVKFNTAGTNPEASVSELKRYLKDSGITILKWTNTGENPRVTYVTAKIEGINTVSSSMPIFILLLTCILTGIVMWRMLKRELVSIGTLYSLGYRKKEIVRHYLNYPLSISLAGGITGTILGVILVRPMLDFMVSYFNIPVDSVVLSLKDIAISVLLPVAFLWASGYYVVNKALRDKPVELMRGGSDRSRINFIEKNLKLDRLKFSTKFKIREMLRSIPRTVFLMLGVILATMLLLMGFVMKSSLDYMMKQTFEEAYKYKYQYSFNSIQQGTVGKGEAFSISPFEMDTADKKVFAVYGINPQSKYIWLKDKAGNKLPTDRVIITKPLAEKLKLQEGEKFTAVNKLDSNVYYFTVDRIADTYLGEYMFLPIDSFNSVLGLPEGSYTGIWSSEQLDIPEDKLLNTSTIDDFKNSFDTMTAPMQSYVGIIAFLAFIIGLIVIYVVTSLIIEENKESISLMKVIGYRKKEVYSLVLNSSSIVVILGYILGIPLIITSISAMINSVSEKLSFVFPVTIEYIYVVVGFVVIYLTYEISKLLSRKKINRISMAEALKANME